MPRHAAAQDNFHSRPILPVLTRTQAQPILLYWPSVIGQRQHLFGHFRRLEHLFCPLTARDNIKAANIIFAYSHLVIGLSGQNLPSGQPFTQPSSAACSMSASYLCPEMSEKVLVSDALATPGPVSSKDVMSNSPKVLTIHPFTLLVFLIVQPEYMPPSIVLFSRTRFSQGRNLKRVLEICLYFIRQTIC